MSQRECHRLISLGVYNGRYDGIINLEALTKLEEFICANVSKIKGVVFNPVIRLRALDLCRLKLFESIGPMRSIVEELRVVTLDKVPRLGIEWLAHAIKAECIALRVGKISSLNILRGLRNLQVLDLFGTEVLDGDLSVRDALKQRLDAQSWGNRIN